MNHRADNVITLKRYLITKAGWQGGYDTANHWTELGK